MRTRQFFDLLIFKTIASLKSEVARYYLNYLWWIFEPLLTMSVFYLIFGILLQRGTKHFAAFLMCGVIPWNWFNRSVNNAAGSIQEAWSLMLQVSIPKVFFPLAVFLRDAFKQLFAVILLLVFLLFYPIPVYVTWVCLPVILLVQGILVLGASILCAAIVPFLPDLRFIINTGLSLMFFGSGVFFDAEAIVLPEHRTILYAVNPMAGLLQAYRDILISGDWPDWAYLGYVLVFSSILLAAAVWLVRHFDAVYPRVSQ